jgi:hypothetical protein
VCYPKNVDIFLTRHSSLWIGQSTDSALSALCILAHPGHALRGMGIQRVVSSSYQLSRLQVIPNRCCQ